MNRVIFIACILLFSLTSNLSYAQCCAAGNPITDDGSASGGGNNVFEASILGTYSYSDIYMEGNQKSDYEYINYSYFLYSSANFS